MKLECPSTKEKEDQRILVFFRDCYRDKVFYIDSVLDNVPAEFNNTWIKTDYVCSTCSPKQEKLLLLNVQINEDIIVISTLKIMLLQKFWMKKNLMKELLIKLLMIGKF